MSGSPRTAARVEGADGHAPASRRTVPRGMTARGEASASGTADAAPGLHYGTTTARWVLTAAVLGSGVASLDATVVGIALPAIGREFSAGVDALQWVSNAYTLTLAGLLLLGGTLGDRYGRRRVFVIGVIWFAGASLLCGLAPSAFLLVVARALQGVGAALLTPGSLAILQASFVPEDRSRAIGAWSGFGGVAGAIGPFLGGWLIGAASWRLVFLINLPLAVAVVLIANRHVPESRAPDDGGPLDVRGAVAITLALVGITYGLTEGPVQGWGSAVVLLALIGGVACAVAFVLSEQRAANPMLPLPIFRSVQFSAANAVTFVVYAALSGALFLLPVVLQVAAGYTPPAVRTGAAPGDGDHARPVGPIGRAGRQDRPSAADVGGAVGHRRGAVPTGPHRRRRGLPDAGAARRRGVRAGARD